MATINVKDHSELRQFDEKILSITKTAWAKELEEHGVFNLEYERLLTDAGTHIDYTKSDNGEHLAYGVFKKGKNSASAVVNVVYTKKPAPTKGWLKMLEVRLSPQYDQSVVKRTGEIWMDIVQLYASAVAGTFALQAVHAANVVKIYGRNDDLLKLLVALATKLQSKDNFDAEMAGRWLVIKRKQKKGKNHGD